MDSIRETGCAPIYTQILHRLLGIMFIETGNIFSWKLMTSNSACYVCLRHYDYRYEPNNGRQHVQWVVQLICIWVTFKNSTIAVKKKKHTNDLLVFLYQWDFAYYWDKAILTMAVLIVTTVTIITPRKNTKKCNVYSGSGDHMGE